MCYINTAKIKAMEPCSSRFDNYLEHYESFEGTPREFVKLDKITYDDKVWVLTRIATKEQLVQWGARCAQSVLHSFESRYPNDKRPRIAVEAALAGTCTEEVRRGAYAAAADAAYYAAAHAAAHAAARAAVYAAYYAADADAADAAAAAASAADAAACAARLDQQKLNLRLLVNIMEGSL